eukprot:4660074-Prymnesium_polylepis.1
MTTRTKKGLPKDAPAIRFKEEAALAAAAMLDAVGPAPDAPTHVAAALPPLQCAVCGVILGSAYGGRGHVIDESCFHIDHTLEELPTWLALQQGIDGLRAQLVAGMA